MILTGLAILIFVPIHVWTFKYGAFYDFGDGVRDLYRIEAGELQLAPRRGVLRRHDGAWSGFICGTACRARFSRLA